MIVVVVVDVVFGVMIDCVDFLVVVNELGFGVEIVLLDGMLFGGGFEVFVICVWDVFKGCIKGFLYVFGYWCLL